MSFVRVFMAWIRSSGKLNDFFSNCVIRYTDRVKDGIYFISKGGKFGLDGVERKFFTR